MADSNDGWLTVRGIADSKEGWLTVRGVDDSKGDSLQ